MYDTIGLRFPVEAFLTNALVLNSFSWPTDTLNLAMHGSNEIVALCELLGVYSKTSLEGLSNFTVMFNRFLVAQQLVNVGFHRYI